MAVLLLLPAVVISQTTAQARLDGLWKDSERGVVTRLSRGPDGRWSGVVIAGPRREEIGKPSFRDLAYDETKRAFVGQLIRPDGDQAVKVVITFDSADAITAVASIFLFSKTLQFTRQPEPG